MSRPTIRLHRQATLSHIPILRSSVSSQLVVESMRIEPVTAVPVIYDRLSMGLMAEFGPVVEYHAYDWRRGVRASGDRLCDRLRALLSQEGMRVALVAHSKEGDSHEQVDLDVVQHCAVFYSHCEHSPRPA